MQYVVVIIIIIALVLLSAICDFIAEYWSILLAIVGGIVGIPVVSILAWMLCKWIYGRTPMGKEHHRQKVERIRQNAREAIRHRREIEERGQREENMEVLQFCKALWKLDYDRIVVDTNVFMNGVPSADTFSETYRRANRFFSAIEKIGLKIFILTSQLNELDNMKNNETKGLKARGAQKKIKDLQDNGLLEIFDDLNGKKTYADPEIIKSCQKMIKQGFRPFVITDDIGLQIQVGGLNVLRKSLAELELIGLGSSPLNIRGVHCGNKFVCVDKDRGGILIANRDRADLCESFSLSVDHRGVYMFQSRTDGQCICVDVKTDGVLAQDVSANDQSSFEFFLVPVKGERPRISLQSKATGKYVSVCENEGNVLKANAPEIRDWEILEFC